MLSEISSAYDPKIIEKFFVEATGQRFSFLYIDLLAPTKEEMFLKHFNGDFSHNIPLDKCTELAGGRILPQALETHTVWRAPG